jgi:hypothetical protein
MRHFFSACPGESDSVISPAIFSASWFRDPDFMLMINDLGRYITNERAFDIKRTTTEDWVEGNP